MKYRNKNYISLGTFCLFLLPIIGFTALFTYLVSDTFRLKTVNNYPLPRTDLRANYAAPPMDMPDFQTGDKALFNFTGDTVLVLNQQDLLADDEVRVLYKLPQGGFQTVDLPDNWLIKVNADTVSANPPTPLNDKLEQYKKTVAK